MEEKVNSAEQETSAAAAAVAVVVVLEVDEKRPAVRHRGLGTHGSERDGTWMHHRIHLQHGMVVPDVVVGIHRRHCHLQVTVSWTVVDPCTFAAVTCAFVVAVVSMYPATHSRIELMEDMYMCK
jgi:hypothetical protein